jgi:hypothetical protein
MKNSIIILLIIFQVSFAQKKDENIGTEVVNVVKPYTPTVSDAFKIKETPTLDDLETTKKEEIKYKIFSFPVASTFTPSKGTAAGVTKPKQEQLYPNYLSLGFGNYGTVNAELFVTHELDKYQYLGGMVRHQSSQGGIKEVVLDDKFSDSSVDLMYGYQRKDVKWFTDLGYKLETYNWYGLPVESKAYNALLIPKINPNHFFNTAKVGSELIISDSFFNKLDLNYIGFWDNYDSRENRFIIKPNFTLDIGGITFKANTGVDYVNTTFAKNYLLKLPKKGDKTNTEKSNFIFNFNPSFQILKQDLSIELGIDLVYLSRLKDVFGGVEFEKDNDFFFYPKANLSYKLVNDIMVTFAGVEGKLIQNSYEGFAKGNKFISPTLSIEPTNQQFDVYGGLRGKLASALSYNLKASFNSSKNQTLYKTNPFLAETVYNYSFGNSFTVVYDNMTTLSFFGELKADVNKNIAIGINGQLFKYSTDKEKQPWNLPAAQATFTTDFVVGPKWYAGTKLFFVGERKDEFTSIGFPLVENTEQTLDGYFDINAHVGFKYNKRFDVFLKGSNLANQRYNRWLNFPVQGAQVLLGASYKFDF